MCKLIGFMIVYVPQLDGVRDYLCYGDVFEAVLKKRGVRRYPLSKRELDKDKLPSLFC